MTLWHQCSDAEREAMIASLVGALPQSRVPDHLRDGLVRYFADGILPGGFLQSVLVLDLDQAVARHTGPGAAVTITLLYQFLTAHAPEQAWGTRQKVLAWTTTPGRFELWAGECVCRTTGCGHIASLHCGRNGACLVCRRECWS